MPRQPITLLIGDSEYRKKLTRTDSLTLGDKYSKFGEIDVFGISQGDTWRIRSQTPAHEPEHTNPRLRTFMLWILLLFCWTGWVFVDRHRVLRIS